MRSGFKVHIKLVVGILLMVLNIGVWINGLYINRERGMDIILALPVLYIGAYLLLRWYKASRLDQTTKSQRWKFILKILLLNYLVLYFIYMISDIIFWDAIDLLTIPGIILPLLLGFFITGCILSREYELFAGIFFLLWYFLTLYGQLRYSEILHRGPYFLLGITVFIHGILYVYYYIRVKPKE